MLAVGDFGGGSDDGVGEGAVEQAQVLVDLRASRLEQTHRADLSALEWATGDREVLDRTLSLCTPEGVDRNAYLSHGVVLDAVLLFVCLRHEPYFASRWVGWGFEA